MGPDGIKIWRSCAFPMSTVIDSRQKWLVWHFTAFQTSTDDQLCSL